MPGIAAIGGDIVHYLQLPGGLLQSEGAFLQRRYRSGDVVDILVDQPGVAGDVVDVLVDQAGPAGNVINFLADKRRPHGDVVNVLGNQPGRPGDVVNRLVQRRCHLGEQVGVTLQRPRGRLKIEGVLLQLPRRVYQGIGPAFQLEKILVDRRDAGPQLRGLQLVGPGGGGNGRVRELAAGDLLLPRPLLEQGRIRRELFVTAPGRGGRQDLRSAVVVGSRVVVVLFADLGDAIDLRGIRRVVPVAVGRQDGEILLTGILHRIVRGHTVQGRQLARVQPPGICQRRAQWRRAKRRRVQELGVPEVFLHPVEGGRVQEVAAGTIVDAVVADAELVIDGGESDA